MKKIFFIVFGIYIQLYAQSTTLTLPTTDNTSNFNVTNSSATLLNLNGDAGFYLGGAYGTGTIPTTGAGTRLMWHPAKAAFRAGYVDGTQWDDSNIGNYSTAMGYLTTASGSYSTAIGRLSRATESICTAIGNAAHAYANYSTAIGYLTTTNGEYSVAIGNGTVASGKNSLAMGAGTNASGESSTAMGNATTASNSYSTAMGVQTLASGIAATSMGQKTTAQAFASLVIGRFNLITGTTDSWVSTEPLFICGNGSDASTTSNALTLLKNGDMTIAGTLTQNSDIRLKENIVPLKNVLSSIDRITPIYYTFKDTLSHPAGRQIGFSAQEIEKEFPELVAKDSQGYLSVEYANMTAVLLQAVKEQNVEIRKQNSELRSKNAELEAKAVKQSKEIAELKKSFEGIANKLAAIESRINTEAGSETQISSNNSSTVKNGTGK